MTFIEHFLTPYLNASHQVKIGGYDSSEGKLTKSDTPDCLVIEVSKDGNIIDLASIGLDAIADEFEPQYVEDRINVERFHAETEDEDVIDLELAIEEIHRSLKAHPYGIDEYDSLNTPEKIKAHLLAGYDIDTFEATYCIPSSQLKGI